MVVIVTNTKNCHSSDTSHSLWFKLLDASIRRSPLPFSSFFSYTSSSLFSSLSPLSSLSSFLLTNPFSHKWSLGSGEGLLPPCIEEVRMDRVSGIHLDVTISCRSGHLHHFLDKRTSSEASLLCYTVSTGRAGPLLWREGMRPPSSAPLSSSTVFPHPVWHGEIRVSSSVFEVN